MLHTKPHVCHIFWNKCFNKRSTVCTWTYEGNVCRRDFWQKSVKNPLSASPVLCFPVTHAQFPSIQLVPLRSKKYCLWMMTSRWSILDRDICQDTRFWIQGKSTHTHTHAQGFNPQVMERVLFPFPLLQNESLILSGTHTHTHLLFFCFSLSFSHVHFMPAGRKRSYMMPITTPGRASHVSVSTSIP